MILTSGHVKVLARLFELVLLKEEVAEFSGSKRGQVRIVLNLGFAVGAMKHTSEKKTRRVKTVSKLMMPCYSVSRDSFLT